MIEKDIDEILTRLTFSKFRNSFKLKKADLSYIQIKGLETIREHTNDFISKRLSPTVIENDGKQTPMRGHPTFIAQHATATCCRKCLYKWHNIRPNVELTKIQQKYIADVIMKWICNEIKTSKE